MSARGDFPLRNPAARAVFSSLLAHGPSSRGDIAQRTGLSAASVTKAVRPLLANGLLEEGDAPGGRVGRPVRALAVRPDAGWFVGVKVTGGEVVAALTDFTGAAVATTRAALPSHRVEAVVSTIADVVASLQEQAAAGPDAAASVCVAVSGDVDRERGVVRFSPFLEWTDVPLAALVEAACAKPTLIENDVRAFAQAQGASGAGVGASPLVVVTLGAGIGSAVVIDGEVLTGAFGVSGELGHIPVGDPDVACYCGGRGCVETIAAEPAIVRAVGRAIGAPVATIADASALARHGNQAAAAVFTDAGAAIGRALATVANLVGPARIVVSGEGLASYDLLEQHIRTAFSAQAYGAASRCDVVLQPHSFEDWALGAAAVARHAFVVGQPHDDGAVATNEHYQQIS